MIVNTFSPLKKNAVLSCIVPKLHKLKYNELNQICYFISYFRGMIRTYNLQEMSGGLKLSLTLIFALISSLSCSEFYQQGDLTMSCEKESNGTMTWRISQKNDTESVNNVCKADRYAVCNADYYFCMNVKYKYPLYCRLDMYKCRNATDDCINLGHVVRVSDQFLLEVFKSISSARCKERHYSMSIDINPFPVVFL